MPQYKQGDIIKVPFPFSDDFSRSKVRPAIVVSNEMSNQLDNDIIIAPITSVVRTNVFSLLIDNQDLTFPLPLNSEVRCNKIMVMRQSLVISKISSLKKYKHNDLIEKIYSCLT